MEEFHPWDDALRATCSAPITSVIRHATFQIKQPRDAVLSAARAAKTLGLYAADLPIV